MDDKAYAIFTVEAQRQGFCMFAGMADHATLLCNMRSQTAGI
jgi:hypothetical protein